jgi:hypothetical protein
VEEDPRPGVLRGSGGMGRRSSGPTNLPTCTAWVGLLLECVWLANNLAIVVVPVWLLAAAAWRASGCDDPSRSSARPNPDLSANRAAAVESPTLRPQVVVPAVCGWLTLCHSTSSAQVIRI